MRKAVITTGGTGGHIFPALAVADGLRRRFPDIEILFVGGLHGQEKELAAQNRLEYLGLPVRGFLGRGFKAVGAAWQMLRAIVMARKALKKFRPDIVIGFGGYAAVAGLAAGRLLGVPCMIHEQNSLPGLSNRLAARFARRVCISLPDAAAWFKAEKVLLTGNPVRESITNLYEQRKSGRIEREFGRNLLVLGGSQGAVAVNNATLGDLPRFLRAGVNLRLQTGQADYERVSQAISRFDFDTSCVLPEASAFIYDMAEAYAWADLVLCRAGATTVAELACAGLPAVFIPFPQATHNHQLHNARQMEKLGAGLVLEQKDIGPGSTAEIVLDLFAHPEKLQAMARAALEQARPDAVEKVVEEAVRVAAI